MNDNTKKNSGLIERDEHGRLKKGVVLNPNGRKTRENTLSDCIRDYMAEVVEDGGETLTREARLARALYASAMDGNMTAVTIIRDTAYGKPVERLDAQINRHNPFLEMLEHGTEPKAATDNTDAPKKD